MGYKTINAFPEPSQEKRGRIRTCSPFRTLYTSTTCLSNRVSEQHDVIRGGPVSWARKKKSHVLSPRRKTRADRRACADQRACGVRSRKFRRTRTITSSASSRILVIVLCTLFDRLAFFPEENGRRKTSPGSPYNTVAERPSPLLSNAFWRADDARTTSRFFFSSF